MLVSSQSDMVTSMDLDGCDNFPPSTLLLYQERYPDIETHVEGKQECRA